MTDSEFLSAFLERSLPREKWTHQAHLRFGWLILHQLNFSDACVFAKNKIDYYNQKVGFNIGYHDTITKAYLCLIQDRINQSPQTSFDEFKANHAELFETQLKILYIYYSKELLWSQKAKEEFVIPDLRSLPSF